MDSLQFESFEMNENTESVQASSVDYCTDEEQQSLAIDFSSNIVLALKDKIKSHNAESKSKINLLQLKRIYREACESNEEDKNLYALARINMFIRMKRDKKISFANKQSEEKKELTGLILETPGVCRVDKYIDLTESWLPLNEDFEQAKADVEKYNLNYKFKSIDDLYLDEYQPIELDY